MRRQFVAVPSSQTIEAGLFGRNKKKNSNSKQAGGNGQASKVTFTIYDENGTRQFAHTFTEVPGKKNAQEQLNDVLKDSYPNVYRQCKQNRDWMYERQSNPASPFDTKRNRNYFAYEIVR